jgi:hypothetical protein
VRDVLILGMTMDQIGQRRGVQGQRWNDYFARRFRECLDRLALLYGLRPSGGRSDPSPLSVIGSAWTKGTETNTKVKITR